MLVIPNPSHSFSALLKLLCAIETSLSYYSLHIFPSQNNFKSYFTKFTTLAIFAIFQLYDFVLVTLSPHFTDRV